MIWIAAATGIASSAPSTPRSAAPASANEQSPEAVDAAMTRLGGTVVRRPLEEVQAEIAAAEDAQRAAAKEARKQLREHRRDQAKEKIQAKIDELKAKIEDLKAKLHRHPAHASSN
jgi:DNA repair exonuclease SbcCD ATPase subunit